MPDPIDPFVRHPELRDRIADPLVSFMRDLRVETLVERFPQLEALRDWVHSDSYREATRMRALAGRMEGDLWVFGYGSLMWDPALRFAEVRRATVRGFARRLILMDVNGGRGTKEAPGLMAALDLGDFCEGVAFRIAAENVNTETEILWRREMIGPGYQPLFVEAEIDGGAVEALAFVADHDTDAIRPDLSRVEQVRYIAGGAGVLGTSRDYLAGIVDHFAHLGIHDADCTALLQDVDAYLAASRQTSREGL